MKSTATGGTSHSGLPYLEAGGVTRPRNAGRDSLPYSKTQQAQSCRIAPDVGSVGSVDSTRSARDHSTSISAGPELAPHSDQRCVRESKSVFSICVAPAHSVIACIGSMAGDVFIAVVCDGAASVNRALGRTR